MTQENTPPHGQPQQQKPPYAQPVPYNPQPQIYPAQQPVQYVQQPPVYYPQQYPYPYFPPRPQQRDGFGIASLTLAIAGVALGILRYVIVTNAPETVLLATSLLLAMIVAEFGCYIAAVALGVHGRNLYVRRQASGQGAASWGMGLGILLLILSGLSLFTLK